MRQYFSAAHLYKRVFGLMLIGLTAVPAFGARTGCPEAKLEAIQVSDTKIMYLQKGQRWRTLGYLNNNDGTEARYAALLEAQSNSLRVIVGYAIENYDCTKVDYETPAFLVRTYGR